MAVQRRRLVRSPLRRKPALEQALVERWESADDDTLWSVLDAAWLTGLSRGTIASRVASGALPATTEPKHGWVRIRTDALRPLVDVSRRSYGPRPRPNAD